MELKKTIQADLERERSTFFLLGFTVALATLFVLLEWSSEEDFSSGWADIASVYMNEPIAEELIQLPVESAVPVENKEKNERQESLPVVYEDFNPVEKETSVEEEILTKLFDEADPVRQPEITHEEVLQELEEKNIFTEAEILPEYPDGYIELNRFLFRNIIYPADALRQKIEGRVWCSFFINPDGSISDICVEEGVHVSLDQEAVRVLKLMPVWTPGIKNGKPLRVKYYLPIVFRL